MISSVFLVVKAATLVDPGHTRHRLRNPMNPFGVAELITERKRRSSNV